MDHLNLFTDADVAVLRKLIASDKNAVKNTRQRPYGQGPVDYEQPAPEVYVCRAPSGGIPGFRSENTGTGTAVDPTYADCQLFARVESTGDLQEVEGFTVRVYNLSTQSVGAYEWVLTERDKFGTWWTNSGQSIGGPFLAQLRSRCRSSRALGCEEDGLGGGVWSYSFIEVELDSSGNPTFPDNPRTGQCDGFIEAYRQVRGDSVTQEEQRIFLSDIFTSGSWQISNGFTTTIALGASAGTVEAALEAGLGMPCSVVSVGGYGGYYRVIWDGVGARDLLEVSLNTLAPLTGSTPAVHLNAINACYTPPVAKIGSIVRMYPCQNDTFYKFPLEMGAWESERLYGYSSDTTKTINVVALDNLGSPYITPIERC